MNSKQLRIFYTVILTIWLASILGLSHHLDEPKVLTVEQYADRLCQELYGPQVGHIWVDAALQCQTVRGEIVEVRKP